ncbi:MAG: alpha-glucosidase C-terminal domain-containing protein [Gracilimonas sp.]|nr:alpha-glucosidase C-terminal domain-containing protein [Gracilimonas sp.]
MVNAHILHHDSGKKIVIFKRKYEQQQIFVILNRSESEQAIDLREIIGEKNLQDMLDGTSYVTSSIKINPLSGLILK